MSCRPRLTGGYKAATPAPRGAWAGVAEAGGAQRVPFLGAVAKLHGEVRGLRGGRWRAVRTLRPGSLRSVE